MPQVHPSALIDPAAELADDVSVGPFCVVGPGVQLDAGVQLASHVVIEGQTRLGAGTRVWPFAALGGAPQDLKHDGSQTRLEVGARCELRENVTLHRGTSGGGGVTRIGDRCLLMVGCHVGHDSQVGDRCIFANQVHLGGHCAVGEGVNIGAITGVHQQVRIGDEAFIGGGSIVVRDVIPFGMATGNRALLQGINLRGLRRQGVAREHIRQLQELVHQLFGSDEGTLAERIRDARADHPMAQRILDFVRAGDRRRFLTADLG